MEKRLAEMVAWIISLIDVNPNRQSRKDIERRSFLFLGWSYLKELLDIWNFLAEGCREGWLARFNLVLTIHHVVFRATGETWRTESITLGLIRSKCTFCRASWGLLLQLYRSWNLQRQAFCSNCNESRGTRKDQRTKEKATEMSEVSVHRLWCDPYSDYIT